MSQKKPSKSKPGKSLPQAIGYLLVALGLIGFFAASTLAIEKVALLKDPSYTPSCNLSPILSCGSVMSTKQAEAFGFPNPFIGVAGFAIVATTGMGILAGATFRRWYWLGLQVGVTFGMGFIGWLMYQSIFNIGALCPYCMVVWSVMIPLFWYVTLYNLRESNIRLKGKWVSINNFAQTHHADILFILYLIPVLIILNKFWYYWSTLI